MIPKLKTIPQLIAEVTAEQPSILPAIDKLYSCMKDGSIHVYMVNDIPLLSQDEVYDSFEISLNSINSSPEVKSTEEPLFSYISTK